MIRLNSITKHYGDKKLFTAYNLTVDTKEKVLLSAPSGSGKTTLIRLMMGFEVPDSGTVQIGGLTMSPQNIRQIREQIAYVSQDTDLSLGTVREQLDAIFAFRVNRSIGDYLERFTGMCTDFHLTEAVLTEPVSKLSGGERQRVALLIALILDRPYLILDEITSGLDGHLKRHMADKILSMDKTVVIISHDELWHGYPQIREVTLG